MAEKAESNEARSKKNDIGDTCNVCKIHFPDLHELVEHLQSKEHKKKLLKNHYGKKHLAEQAERDKKNSTGETETIEKPDSDDDSDNDFTEYKCEVCNKTIISKLNYDLHMNGRKHKNKLKAKNALDEMIRDGKVPNPNEKPKEDNVFNELFPWLAQDSNYECKLCKKKCLTPTAYNQHCLSEGHKKKVKLVEGSESKEINGQSLAEAVANGSEFYCDMCKKHFIGLVPYTQHMEGVSHLKKEQHFKELDEIRHLAIINEDDSNLTCKECSKVFSGPIPFKIHLKTTAHSKIKQKSEIINDLELSFPELAIEEGGMLRCKVCLTVFSGPKSAKDHCKSAKHRNKVEMKAKQKKNKQQKNDKNLLAKDDNANSKESDSEDSSDFEEL